MWVRLTGAITALVLASAVPQSTLGPSGSAGRASSVLRLMRRRYPVGQVEGVIPLEVIDDFHPGATGYRVLYKSTGYDGDPTAVSGIIRVPDGPAPAEGRKVIAWTHGTVSVAPHCSPSLVPNYASALVGIAEFIEGRLRDRRHRLPGSAERPAHTPTSSATPRERERWTTYAPRETWLRPTRAPISWSGASRKVGMASLFAGSWPRPMPRS